MFNHRYAVCFLAGLALACVPMALAQGTYTQIDYPGSLGTFVSGINSAGDISGTWADGNASRHGFVLRGGAYTSFDYPGTNITFAGGLNDFGQVVGTGVFVNGTAVVGFVYDVNTFVFTTFAYPDPMDYTMLSAINNSRNVVGEVQLNGNTPVVGFTLVRGKFQKVVPAGFGDSNPTAINNHGVVIGTANRGPNAVSFRYSHGKFQRLNIPAPSAYAVGINDLGTLVGSYSPSEGITRGFVYEDEVFQPIVVPGSGSFSAATAVNNSGVVVGYFFSPDLSEHGFIWTPPADAAKK